MKNEHLNGLKIVLITQGLSRIFFPLIRSRHKIVGVIESVPREKNFLVNLLRMDSILNAIQIGLKVNGDGFVSVLES